MTVAKKAVIAVCVLAVLAIVGYLLFAADGEASGGSSGMGRTAGALSSPTGQDPSPTADEGTPATTV